MSSESVYRCPLTGAQLHELPADHPLASGFTGARALDGLLAEPDERFAYPVVDGIPHLSPGWAMGDVPACPVSGERIEAIREEVEVYDAVALDDSGQLEAATRALFGRSFVRSAGAGEPLGHFPDPVPVWVDSMGGADLQHEAYAHLRPVEGKRFLQVGGSGSHAVKLLKAGAAEAYLLTPAFEEARLGRALAREMGVEDRFRGVVAIAEAMPFADRSFDSVYGGGCLHHTDIDRCLPETSRVLVEGGRASFVDPLENPIYSTWEKLSGFRFCGAEEHVDDHPLEREELEGLAGAHFSAHQLVCSGGPVRYGIVLLERGLGLRLPTTWTRSWMLLERRLLSSLGLSRFLGCVGTLLTR